MRKLIFTLCVLFLATGAFAQIEQGTMMVGGNFGLQFGTEKSKSNSVSVTRGNYTSFHLAPQFGYFVIDNLALGGSLDLTLTSFKEEGSGDKDNSTMILFSPFVRYYLNQGIFFEGKVGLGSAVDKNENGNTITKTNYGVTRLALGAGYAFFLNDNVALEPMIGYESHSLKYKDVNGDPRDVEAGLFIRVGFQIYLR